MTRTRATDVVGLSVSKASQSPSQKSNWRCSAAEQEAAWGMSAKDPNFLSALSLLVKNRIAQTAPSFGHSSIIFIITFPFFTFPAVRLMNRSDLSSRMFAGRVEH